MSEFVLIVWTILSAPCMADNGAEQFCPVDITPAFQIGTYRKAENCHAALATIKASRADVSFVAQCVSRDK